MEKIGSIANRSLVPRASRSNSDDRSRSALAVRRLGSMPAIRNRTTDVDLPRLIWEAWIEPGKPRLLRRPLRDDERAALEARKVELEPWVVGYHPEEIDAAAVALFEMFGGFRSMAAQGDAKLAATVDGLLHTVLLPFPLWAIQKASAEIRVNGVLRDGRFDRQWAPSDAEIVEAVGKAARLYRDQYDSAVALLRAEVAR